MGGIWWFKALGWQTTCARHLGVAALAVMVAVGCGPRLGDSEVDLVLEDIVAAHEQSRLKQRTPAPFRQTLRYQIQGRDRVGDLYLSPEGALAGLVLVPGIVPEGKDDTRLVALATTLARLRFAILVPDLVGLRRQRMRTSDVREVADAFLYLMSRPELVPGGHAGMAGIRQLLIEKEFLEKKCEQLGIDLSERP